MPTFFSPVFDRFLAVAPVSAAAWQWYWSSTEEASA
jgi:hypothetical protein